MQTNNLKRIHPNMKRVIVARGGKRGKTAGRGGKGQSARAGNKRRPEWRDIIKRVPKLRGRGKNSNKSFQDRMFVVNLSIVESRFSANDQVSPTTLVEKGIVSTISGRIPNIKILGDGEITKSVKVSGCEISGSAKEKIIKAGGSVEATKMTIAAEAKTATQDKKAVASKDKAMADSNKKVVEKVAKVPKVSVKKPASEKGEKKSSEKADKPAKPAEKKATNSLSS